jgi:hypothetical protein
MNIELTVDFKDVVAALDSTAQRQMPFIMAKTLTGIAQDVQARIKKQLSVKFDKPTPFTVRGVFMERAEKTRLQAAVYFPESQDASGRAQREYIRPGAEGTSARHQKKTEFVLTRMGFLPAGWVTVPGSFFKDGNKFDQYGNISGAYYKNIIRGLGITTKLKPKPLTKAAQKRVRAMGVESEYIAIGTGVNKLGKNGGWLPGGVYKRTGPGGRKLVQYLLFVRKASYRKRIDMQEEALKALQESGQARFDEAIKLVTDQFKAR